jgi:hypothetical protein
MLAVNQVASQHCLQSLLPVFLIRNIFSDNSLMMARNLQVHLCYFGIILLDDVFKAIVLTLL